MAELEIHGAGLAQRERHEIPEGHTLLVGRSPDPARAGFVAPVTTVALSSQSISTNHFAAWEQDGATCLRDLHSRNGTWLRLPPAATVRVEPAASLTVQLAAPPSVAAGSIAEPSDAEWQGRGDYARGVAAAIGRWGASQGMSLGVTALARMPAALAGYPGHLPLADGTVLEVGAGGRTLDDGAHALFGVLWRYVTRQNAIFLAEEESRDDGLILASDAIRAAHRQVLEAAQRGARALLLLGPSGAGKEGLARCFHRATGRSGAFVTRNCGMFSKELLRAELFGAEVGAFTGASKRIVGAVERAHGGTLFLDEIGELAAEVQPVLLRFLDSGEYEPLGKYGQPSIADVRVVAATHKDLRAATRAGSFRVDLWYRLGVQVVAVPPLCERPADLTTYLELRRLPSGVSIWQALTADAQALLLSQPWEGNFRELMNFAEQLPLGARPGSIDAAACRAALERVSLGTPAATRSDVPRSPVPALGDETWERLALTSLQAFREDLGKALPETWDEVKLYVEKYWKPLAFAHLGGVAGDDDLARGAISGLTRRLQTDRTTASKQLARFQERFR